MPADADVHFKTRRILAAEDGKVLVQADFKAAEPRYLAMLFERGLRERDGRLQAEQKRLDSERWARHPELMQLKRQVAKPYTGRPSNPICFPEYDHDPLWLTFQRGQDPYNALLMAMLPEEHGAAVLEGREVDWFKENRTNGKRAFLALGYGSSPKTLAPQLGWTEQRTEDAIDTMKNHYKMLEPLTELTKREVIRLGEVRTLWDRPRKMNGFYQLVQPDPVTIKYCLKKPTWREYRMEIIPLGSTAYGTQAFVRRVVCSPGNDRWHLVWEADEEGKLKHLDKGDAFVTNNRERHFNQPPFANLSHRCITAVEGSDQLTRELPRLEDAVRQAFNSLCQSTGADHLRKAMNDVDGELLQSSRYSDVKLVLTVHDSLIFEAPEERAEEFARAAAAVISRRPEWATIDFPVEVEIGKNLGELEEYKLPGPNGEVGLIGKIGDWNSRIRNRLGNFIGRCRDWMKRMTGK